MVFAAADASDGVAKLPASLADFRRDAMPSPRWWKHLCRRNPSVFGSVGVHARIGGGIYRCRRTAQQAAADVPRFDYRNSSRQLLLEGPATNLFLNAFTPATQTITVTNA
ncbi:MAG: hypothetical protein AAAC47_17620, partial [Pararhizobium sp.]